MLKALYNLFLAPLLPTRPVQAVGSMGATHCGLVRKNNEDCFLADNENRLWIVCDGMGGHAGGEQASSTACSTIAQQLAAGMDLKEATLAAHEAVKNIEVREENTSRPGSTVVALRFLANEWELVWVGDSRCWLLEDKQMITQLSHDHTVVQQLIDWGSITPEEARNHPDRHRLKQALGLGTAPLVIGHQKNPLRRRQTFLLASDGLAHWDFPDRLIPLLREPDLTRSVERLIDESLAEGGHDNVSCVVIRTT